jgi:hypothetical protein
MLRALIWPLFASSAWARLATVVAPRHVRAQFRHLFCCSAWAQPATEVASTTGEGACVACSLDPLDPSRPLWWRVRKVKALLWPLFSPSAWAQLSTIVACMKNEVVAVAYVRSVGLGSARTCGGGYDC